MVTEVFTRLDEVLAGIHRAGIVHVGAHKGQEVPYYRRAGFERIVLVEPNPARADQLDRLPGVEVHRCAASTRRGGATLHLTRYDTQASILRPHGRTTATVEVPTRPLADLQTGCNVAVLDVQGSELDVLRSADLTALDALVVETCTKVRYDGAATREEIHDFLAGWTHLGAFEHRQPWLADEVWRR